jgi:hypothetical protein
MRPSTTPSEKTDEGFEFTPQAHTEEEAAGGVVEGMKEGGTMVTRAHVRTVRSSFEGFQRKQKPAAVLSRVNTKFDSKQPQPQQEQQRPDKTTAGAAVLGREGSLRNLPTTIPPTTTTTNSHANRGTLRFEERTMSLLQRLNERATVGTVGTGGAPVPVRNTTSKLVVVEALNGLDSDDDLSASGGGSGGKPSR